MSGSGLLNIKETVEEYVNRDDWRVKANANQGYSLGGLNFYISGKVIGNYWLNEIFDKESAELHRDGAFYIHDLDSLSPYCCGWDLYSFLVQGFGGVEGRVSSYPPKHLSTAVSQMVAFMCTVQGEWAGAQAFSDVSILLAPFVKVDKLSYKEVKQCMQYFVFSLNQPQRSYSQTPFTNITLNWSVPEKYKDQPAIVGGKPAKFTYGECYNEMHMINRALFEIYLEGDANGRVLSFPIPTVNVTKEFNWDHPNVDLLMELTAKYGQCYFQNLVNSDMTEDDIRSMCPLHPDELVLVKEGAQVKQIRIQELVDNGNYDKYKVLFRDKWCKIRNTIKYQSNSVIEIELSNGKTIRMDSSHIQPIYKWVDVTASELRPGVMIPVWEDSMVKWFEITQIRHIDYTGPVYCIEVDSMDHYFTMGNGIITHNCRLNLDLRELYHKGGGLFGSGVMTGSIGVVTINLARVGYEYRGDWEGVKGRIRYLVHKAKDVLEVRRAAVKEYLDKGLYPYSKVFLKRGFDTYFSTVGVVGGNEFVLNFTGSESDITCPEGHKMCLDILRLIREELVSVQEATGNLYNLEATPAEGANHRLARIDRKRGIITAGTDERPYYTNSTQIPVDKKMGIFDALDHQDDLQSCYTGGTVFHIYINERPLPGACKGLLRRVLNKYRMPYITITPIFSTCLSCGYIEGEHSKCPKCGSDVEVWTRVMGYHRPVRSYNDGKTQEFYERVPYNVER